MGKNGERTLMPHVVLLTNLQTLWLCDNITLLPLLLLTDRGHNHKRTHHLIVNTFLATFLRFGHSHVYVPIKSLSLQVWESPDI